MQIPCKPVRGRLIYVQVSVQTTFVIKKGAIIPIDNPTTPPKSRECSQIMAFGHRTPAIGSRPGVSLRYSTVQYSTVPSALPKEVATGSTVALIKKLDFETAALHVYVR